MNTSDQINEIALALSKAQSVMTGAKKDSKNPFFKSDYSDLKSVMEAISKPFADNDLAFVQGAEANEQRVAVSTRIIHKSGQWIESTTELPPTKADAQGWGSAITYAKRYGLQALAGVPSVDDDGNEAVKQVTKPAKLDNSIVAKIEKCQTADELKAVWESMPKSQHLTYNAIKEQAKERLAA